MTSPLRAFLPATERALFQRIARAQSEGRAPSLTAAVARDGEPVWTAVRPSPEGGGPGVDVQYRIGSITKTFTAVLVMRLRDEGLLDLQDPLDQYLPGTDAGKATIAQLLCHSAGLSAETPSPWWERSSASLRPTLPDVLGGKPHKHPAGRRFHYSNPGYTVLGALIEAVRDAPWGDVFRREILEPLAMTRTSLEPQAPCAEGWAVHPWADVLLPEPVEDLGLMAPAGQLWSTAGDLCRFAALFTEGDERVLNAASVREMCTPSVPAEAGEWDSTYGLGLQIIRRDGRTLVGHGGSLPGFVAGLWVGVEDGIAASVLANATSGPLPSVVATELVRIVAEAEPRIPEPWRPLQEVDRDLVELTGPWYWGTYAFGLRLLPGRVLSLAPLAGPGRRSRFTAEPDGTWMGENGYYAGETLRVVRHRDGSVRHLDLGSFVFTREPYEPEAGVPGGVDEEGWRGLSE
ncbi:serine hydrolase domain-containing protein [Streptomyces albipurpureus]|uniref:Beta-lactamase family protein n=1 Tax=Streptomyces albipurpureus TaxID=2897419 RepID=A0ABT0UVS8_9ACTN|nr:serine hydrolase domain-containing protein [Streptomyces sp. CWNU-1]MCM2391463.1 beta-lactamase family protein [Streptomyces sp. CWNU-1]